MNFECEVKEIIPLETFCIVIGNVLEIGASTKNVLDKIYALGNMNYGSIAKISVDKVGR